MCNQLVVKEGALVFAVLSYGTFNVSKALATLAAAHISTSCPVNFLISSSLLFSSLTKDFFKSSALLRSTLIPCSRISIKIGCKLVSRSKILDKFCCCISILNLFQSFKVSSASCSA